MTDAVKMATEWLRACSDWLLTNDLDMQMPDGVLDTDPLDIAAALEQAGEPVGREAMSRVRHALDPQDAFNSWEQKRGVWPRVFSDEAFKAGWHSALSANICAAMTDKISHDVAALVVTGREAWEYLQEHCPHDDVTVALENALEAFASRVCWDDEGGTIPDAHADPCTCAMSEIQRLGQEFDAGEVKAYLYERGDRSFFEREMKPAEFYPNWKITPLYAHPPQSRGQAFDGDGEGFAIGDPVEKFTGEAIWHGVVVASYLTSKGKRRYVVEVKPQGFQMIAVPSQLRALSSAKRGEGEG